MIPSGVILDGEGARMNDAATAWVAPVFLSLSNPDTETVRGAQVWVLNPGATDAKVTVRFLRAVNGSLVSESAETVKAKTSEIFVVGTDFTDEWGWCHITSDQPVAPWGLTCFETGGETGYLNMNWYRYEVPQRQAQVKRPT